MSALAIPRALWTCRLRSDRSSFIKGGPLGRPDRFLATTRKPPCQRSKGIRPLSALASRHGVGGGGGFFSVRPVAAV